MALLPQRETARQSNLYAVPFQIERGGMLSLTTLSGVQYAVYEMDPDSTTTPLGIMQYDTTEVDLYRMPVAPWSSHNAYPEFRHLPYIIEGHVITNAIDSTVTSINVNDPCFLAPSGMLTNSDKYGTVQVGRFLSTLNADYLGVIPLPTQIRVAGNDAIVNPDPVFARSAGWAKVSIQL